MTRLPRIEGAALVRALEREGFTVIRRRGSHVSLRHSSDGRRTTVPVHAGATLPAGTLSGILRDIDLDPDDLRDLLR